MQTKRYNISKPKKYTTRNGEEKTVWNNIGTLTEFYRDDGSISRMIEIPTINLEAQVFPFKDETPIQRVPVNQPINDLEKPLDTPPQKEEPSIDISDIPF